MDAAKFEVVKEELGKHFATQSWIDGADAAMAFETLTEPTYDVPAEPVIPEQFSEEGDNSVEDPEYESKYLHSRMQLTMYTRNHDEWARNAKKWSRNRSRMFAIVLQHCPKDLVQKLKSNPRFTETNSFKDVIAFTRIIFDVAHARNDTTQGTMTVVSSDVALYATCMSKTERPVDFCRTFQVNVDTINTRGGCAGHHPQLIAEYGHLLCEERGLGAETGDPNELKKILVYAERMSCEEYLSCLFVLVADGGMFQGIKLTLDNQYLMYKDAYPTTMT